MTVSFRVKLLATHAAVALAVSAVTLFLVERSVSHRMEDQIDRRLEAQASAVATWVEGARHPDRLAPRLAGVVGARVTILNAEGVAVGESLEPSGEPVQASEGQAGEVSAARSGSIGRETRFSPVDRAQVRYVAVPARGGLVVRLGLPIGEIDDTKADLRRRLGLAAGVSMLLALALAALVAGPLTHRLREATRIARRIGAGDYEVPKSTTARDEVGVLARALETAAAEMRETESRRRAFLATVAHEIRTPITSIRGYAQTLSAPEVAPHDRDEFVQIIHRNAVRVGELVDNLLELEALEADRGPDLASDGVPLAPVVQHVVRTLRGRAEELGAEVVGDLPEDLTARGDADAIERILLNLIDNALRHGGAGVRVDIRARRDADRVAITVSDNGPGVPAEQRARIFDRFYRGGAAGDPTRRGTGLGLAIARELARNMGGNLTASEAEPRGATFTLDLLAA